MGQKPPYGNRGTGKGKDNKRDGGSAAGRGFKKYEGEGSRAKTGYKSSGDSRDEKRGSDTSQGYKGRGKEGGYKPAADRQTDGPKRPYQRDDNRERRYAKPDQDKKPYESRGDRKPYSRDADRTQDRPAYRKDAGEKRPYGKDRNDKGYGDKPARKPYSRDTDSAQDRPPYRKDTGEKRPYGKDREDKGYGDKPARKPYSRDADSTQDRPPYRKDAGEKRPYGKDRDDKGYGDKPARKAYSRNADSAKDRPPYRKDAGEKRPYGKDREEKRYGDKPGFSDKDGDKPYNRDNKKDFEPDTRSEGKEQDANKSTEPPVRKSWRFEDADLSFGKDSDRNKPERKPRRKDDDGDAAQFDESGKPKRSLKKVEEGDFTKAYPLGARKVSGPFRKRFEEEKAAEKEGIKRPRKPKVEEEPEEVKEMTLNKYIAHSGECSRRDAAEMVKQGKVKVNGELMLDPGYRVQPYDKVTIAGKKLTPQRDRVYVLLNKPKGFITTTEDPEGRKTVMELVANAGGDRMYPVGRLDRNTTGLLLLTNDGDLAQKLSHPSHEIKKVYQVTLNKPLTKADFEKIVEGLDLEDGKITVDALAYLDTKNELGLEIHSGRNRIVRRIFESLGYEVEKLDRVMYAGLTKKNLPRSKWRFLEEKEVILLKHFKL